MIVKFWGVRGSVPVPGAQTLRYGGNTACVSVEVEDKVLILDTGTGIRVLGDTLAGTDKEIFILLTHPHTDHVMGFPFFAPLYEPDRRIHLLDHQQNGHTWSLLSLLDGVLSPVRPDMLPSRYTQVRENALDYLRAHGFDITRLATNHPGGAYGYCITHQGCSLVYMPDNELDPPGPVFTSFEAFAAFCRDADVLIHDAQYLRQDMPGKRGWGHSLVHQACALAVAAQVRHLVLFHHDPDRSDEDMDRVQAAARALLEPHGITCTVAYEGLAFDWQTLRPALLSKMGVLSTRDARCSRSATRAPQPA